MNNLKIVQAYCEQTEVRDRLRDMMLVIMNLNKKGKWDGGSRTSRRVRKNKACGSINAFVEGVSTELYNLIVSHPDYHEVLDFGHPMSPDREAIKEHIERREAIYDTVDTYLAGLASDLRTEVAPDFKLFAKQYVLATEHISVTEGNFVVNSPKHTHLLRIDETEKGAFDPINGYLNMAGQIGQVHSNACEVISNTAARCDRYNWDVNCHLRRHLLETETERESLMSGSLFSALKTLFRASPLEVLSIAIKTPYTNLDYRLRKYARLLIAITAGKAVRELFRTDEPYDFTDSVREAIETDIIDSGMSLEDALLISDIPVEEAAQLLWSKTITQRQLTLARGYRMGIDTKTTNIWAEIDAIASGIVNALLQLGDDLALIIGDADDPDHKHARLILATYLVEHCHYFAGQDPGSEEMDSFIKLILSPLMYGARQQGVHKSLIGQPYEEGVEVDMELYAEANQFMMGLPAFDGCTPEELNESIGALCEEIGEAYHECFPQLSAAMEQVNDMIIDILLDGKIPRLFTPSGSVILLSLVRRKDTTHQVTFEYGDDDKTKEVWVSQKGLCIRDLVSAAFSWILHNTDAEIISLLSVRLGDLSIPHFTNHDAVFCRYCDIPIVVREFTAACNEVNSDQELKKWGCNAGTFVPFPDTARTLVS
jgi:hypothetical protein